MLIPQPQRIRPKKISIIVFKDAVLTSISATLEILMGTNHYLEETGQKIAFEVELVGDSQKDTDLLMPARFMCQKSIPELDETDLIIVPSFMGHPGRVLSRYRNVVEKIKSMYSSGSEVVSLCRGSYFLAEAGLLTDKPCTSHWRSIEDMQQRYPDLILQPDVIITDQEGVYTSGGAFSSIHVVLYLVEKFCGKEVAIQISKIFSIDMDKVSQAHFAVFRGQREHGDEEILNAQSYIEQNYRNGITVDEVAERTHMSKRNFIRRFKKATQNTPIEYIQRVRVEAAKKGFESGHKNINEIMYEVGYSDSKSFRSVFRRVTGLSPVEYRKKYSREVPVF